MQVLALNSSKERLLALDSHTDQATEQTEITKKLLSQIDESLSQTARIRDQNSYIFAGEHVANCEEDLNEVQEQMHQDATSLN